MRAALLVILFFAASWPAHAQVKQNDRGWFCGPPGDWETTTFGIGTGKRGNWTGLILNNFSFTESEGAFVDEGKVIITAKKILKVEFSAINRNAKDVGLTAQFAGFDVFGGVTFAVSVRPKMYTVSSGGNSTASEVVYITDPVLPQTTKICAKFVLDDRS